MDPFHRRWYQFFFLIVQVQAFILRRSNPSFLNGSPSKLFLSSSPQNPSSQDIKDTRTETHGIVVVFGKPGAGKSTVADAAVDLLSKSHHKDIMCEGLDLDVCVPQWMRDNFAKGIYPTLEERKNFALDACDYVEKEIDKRKLEKVKPSSDTPLKMGAIVSFSFVNTDLRDVFRARFPQAIWILIDTTDNEALRRIKMREDHFYKGAKGDNQDEEVDSKLGESDLEVQDSAAAADDDENSEWKFAPVTFDHILLDGTIGIEENALKVKDIFLDNVLH